MTQELHATIGTSPHADEGSGDFNWVLKVGPTPTGKLDGSIEAVAATFLVRPTGDLDQTYATSSNDGGKTWTNIPNNMIWKVSGGGNIMYRIYAPVGGVEFQMNA